MTKPRCNGKLKAFASERIGLYLVMKDGKKVNFCDLHLFWTDGYSDSNHNVYYSGPQGTAREGIAHIDRTKAQKTLYEKHGDVPLEAAIEEGGAAMFFRDNKKKVYDFWLFGPISFQDQGYGSLIAEMKGFTFPTIRTRHFAKPKKVGYFATPQMSESWTHFPKDYVGKSSRCTLYASNFYHKDKYQSASNYAGTLTDKRKGAVAIELPAGVKKVVWKIEEASGRRTDCQIYDDKG